MVFHKYQFHHCFLHLLALSTYHGSETKYKALGIFWIKLWKNEQSSETLILEIRPLVLEKNEFDFTEFYTNLALDCTKASNEDCKMFTE